ncbi:sensor histidine kinase [Aliiglaciecola lipolytica]|uniref:Two-component system, unclassified family, sensor kinase n=1 Tax=Aliiglaciecola lipolytica E3 TaxID=1127673 RepID=K6YK16_9ALTE|nr:histidine kinase [Aliiglaciecola lipolytica]GAC16953.1 two-component system, unclassified family, sensor kinase [Aliiglaciecola lipolytica E3]
MAQTNHFFNRYFWFANTFFWLAVHALYTHIKFLAFEQTDQNPNWTELWISISPWFVLWIGVTAIIFKLVQRTNRSPKPVAFKVLFHLAWMTVILIVYWAIAHLLVIAVSERTIDQFSYWFTRTITQNAQLDIFMYLGVLGAAMALRFYHNAVEESIELKRLHHALIQEQLKTLRSQLNPHFLFNALNTIASLVRLKREKDAVTALSELSVMLRKILETKNHDDIKVKDEIAFIKSYLAIQKMRFADKLDTHIHVQPECLDLAIPNMLLHPLVENAVQHGSQLESSRNLLNLDISIDKNELKVVLTNKVAKNDQHNGFGIGLSNTRERLAKLYGHFRLELHPLDNDLFETLLAIPIGGQDA